MCDPISYVKSTTKFVVDNAKFVQINDDAVKRFSQDICEKELNIVEWDADGWHWNDDAKDVGPLTCQYIFVLDSLNYCFWPCEGFEYDTLALGLKAVLEADIHALDADRLMEVTPATLSEWYKPWTLPQLEERAMKLREVGYILKKRFNGLAMNMVKEAKNSAVELVNLVVSNFFGFRDEAVYKGRQIFLYKRAQIFVGDVWAAYGKNICDDHLVGFTDMAELTMFADYRVPQILRPLGIMEYNEELTKIIDSKEEIPFSCEMEVELRAATVQAVEMIKEEVARLGKPMLSVEIDWYLWQQGEKLKETIPPHHRTLTVFY